MDAQSQTDLRSDKLWFQPFPGGTECHLFCDDALTGVMHLSEDLVAALLPL